MPKPRIVILAGPNGAGKTTVSKYLLPDVFEIEEFVNADRIAAGLSVFSPESVAFEAGRIMLRRLRELAAGNVNFAFESTLSSRTFARFLTRCKAQGYTVHIFYVALPSPELAVNRVALRVKLGGHNIPQADIERRFQRSLHNFYSLYLPLADRWIVLDNATGTLEPIAHGTTRRTNVEDSDKWLNLKRLAQ